MNKRLKWIPAFAAALILAGQVPVHSQDKLGPYLEIELKRVEETYRLMDKYAQEIWPGWNNYMNIEFRVQYPNLVFLLIGPRERVPEGYELVPGRTLRGKQIYLNRKEELPIKIQPPLTGGGGGGLTIRIMLSENKITPEQEAEAIAKNLKEPNPAFQPPASSEHEMLLYVHEFFHGYQTQAIKSMREMEEKIRKARDDKEKAKKPEEPKVDKAKKPEPRGERREFQVNPEYSTYSSIEGLALLNAFQEKDKKKALEAFKDYSVAREIKHKKHMPDWAAQEEVRTTVMEGTASYSDAKMAMLVRDKKYRPKMTSNDDPFFFGFKYAGGYVREKTVDSIKGIPENTLDTLGKCYTYGLFQCLLLDRFFPGWKKEFFENDRNLDEVTAGNLKLTEQEKAAIAARFKEKYKYDELYAKHAAVIKNRDEVKELVTSRKGRTYIIDLQKTRELIIPEGRGRFVVVGVTGYFLNGIKEYRLGDIVLTTWNTPVHKPFLYTIEWTDTEDRGEEKAYTFDFEKQEGDVYKNVVFTTPGFTLKAPEVQIQEDKDKNELRIVVLRKVAK
jgi:hypothetical protein